MKIERRFVFRGNAAVVGGRISRPRDLVIDAGGASSLTVAGGGSRGALKRTRFGGFLSVGSATTSARGVFDNRRQLRERTFGRVSEDALSSTTVVRVDVRQLAVGASPVFRIAELRARLTGTTSPEARQPSIKPGDLRISGVEIGGHTLAIEIEKDLFSRYDTHDGLLEAASSPDFATEYGMNFPAFGATGARRFEEMNYGTVVRRIRWKGRPYPDAAIDGHTVVVPGFGTIFFGEMFVTALSRRLTLVRMQLGSPIGGSVACGEIETNGSWYP